MSLCLSFELLAVFQLEIWTNVASYHEANGVGALTLDRILLQCTQNRNVQFHRRYKTRILMSEHTNLSIRRRTVYYSRATNGDILQNELDGSSTPVPLGADFGRLTDCRFVSREVQWIPVRGAIVCNGIAS